MRALLVFWALSSTAFGAEGTMVEEFVPRTPLRFEGGVGLPQPLTLGLSYALSDNARAYVQGGYFRYPLIGGAQAFGISSLELGWRSNLTEHLELSLFSGYRSVVASMNQGAIPATLGFRTWYAGVFVGWNYRVSRWLEGAFGLGVEFAVLGAAAMSFSDGGGTTWESSPALSRVARWPLPRVTLFRLSLR